MSSPPWNAKAAARRAQVAPAREIARTPPPVPRRHARVHTVHAQECVRDLVLEPWGRYEEQADIASRRTVAALLGRRGLRTVMRYAHLSPAYLSAEVAGRAHRTLEEQRGSIARRSLGQHQGVTDVS